MSAQHQLLLKCDESGCEHRYTCKELTVNNARNMARLFGWTAKGRKDFCPDHPQAEC